MGAFLHETLALLVSHVWGMPIVCVLFSTGLFLALRSGFRPFFKLSHTLELMRGQVSHQQSSGCEGLISPFRSLAISIGATVGTGNIAGVSLAILQGGAGAIFWMWLAAAIGMMTKFFEVSLSVMFRGRDYQNHLQGGPMYMIEVGLPKSFRPAAYIFSLFALVGTLPLFNVNQLCLFMEHTYEISPLFLGLFLAILSWFVMRGGIQMISVICARLVPIMCLLYLALALCMIVMNYSKLPGIFVSIFTEAFTGRAAQGGLSGVTFLGVMSLGVKRGTFSNEAGLGTATLAHGNARTSEPISEGLVAMLGPFIDTIIVSSVTALVVLCQFEQIDASLGDGIVLAGQAFEFSFPGFGLLALGIFLSLFSVSSVLGMASYNKKCWDYLFKGRYGLGSSAFQLWYCGLIFLAALSPMIDLVNLVDLCFAVMMLPNLIAVILLHGRVVTASKAYFRMYLTKK